MEKCYGYKVRFIFLYENNIRNIFRIDKYVVLLEVLTALSVTSCQRANKHRRFELS